MVSFSSQTHVASLTNMKVLSMPTIPEVKFTVSLATISHQVCDFSVYLARSEVYNVQCLVCEDNEHLSMV